MLGPFFFSMAAHCSQWALSTKNSQWTVFGEGWSPWRKKHDTGPFWGNRGFIRSPFRFHRHNWGHVVTGQSTPSEFKDPDFNLSQRDALQSYQSSQLRYFATRENALGAYSVQCVSFLHFLQQIFSLSTRANLPHTTSLWTTATSCPLYRRLQTSIVIDTKWRVINMTPC